ncbi:MAG: hypothetical protein AUI14_13525 [Actinobacteria bacterium 13_2_20CM_2_71_6]|nr:MAG: hypothetical protein AUI14_13525 [Actinobacteria bacterium 13_2_20CM_2_71_6]
MSSVPPDDPALHLTVAYVNTYDLFPEPADHLTPDVAGRLAGRYGQARLAPGLRSADLDELRALRHRFYAVFAGDSDAAKLAALDEVLESIDARARLGADGRLAAIAPDDDPVRHLGAVCANALANAMAVGGPGRFGTCAAHPCACGYVDRTRAGRQRFCCQLCNDRTAAAAYRDRRRSAT